MARRRRRDSSESVGHVFDLVRRPPLAMLEDRRVFHPLGRLRPPLSFHRKARIVIGGKRSATGTGRLPNTVRFQVPKDVAICIRRKQRRQVLFASGKGGSHKVPRRRNMWSEVRC